MIKFWKQKNNKNRAFTLVESLVALSIFTVSILSVLIFLSQGTSNVASVKKKVTAIYLAQEGIEYIRNMRDTYMLYHPSGPEAGWTAFYNKLDLAGCDGDSDPYDGTDVGCYFNPDTLFSLTPPMPITKTPITSCGSSACPTLYYNSGTGQYGYTPGADSGFSRKISIVLVSSALQPEIKEINVFSTVYWTQGTRTSKVKLAESVFNWIE